jgi:hypothetical protein
MCKKLIYLVSFVFVLSLVLTSVASAGHLIGWWKFDGDTLDYSGLDNHGTAFGDPTFVDGKVGSGALEFDGDDYVRMDGLADDIKDNDCTFHGWVKTTDNAGDWFSCNTGTGGNVALWAIDSSQAAMYEGSYQARSTTNVSDGQWHMLTFTRIGSLGTTYVDGVAENTYTANFNFSANDRWSIAQEWDTDTPSDFLSGTVDDVRFYDRALSAAQVWDLFNGIDPTFVKAENPEPADGAIIMDTWANLRWSAGDTAASHDVYFGDNFDDVNEGTAETSHGTQPLTNFIIGFLGFPFPDGLVPGTTYYWRIDEVEADGTTTHTGDVWSFTVPSKKAHEPDPADGAKYVSTDVELSWTAGFGGKLHTVYFGDNFDDVNNAAGGLTQTNTTYTPAGTLELDKDYYWRVDEFDATSTYKGDVWSFKTRPVISIVDPNLVGWWKFDEGYGTTAIDWSGHGNDGTLQGDPQWVDGIINGALEFNGNDFVTMDGVADDMTGNNMSMGAWIKFSNTSEEGILCVNTGGRGNVILMEHDGAQIGMWESSYEVYSGVNVNDGKWHHVMYTRSGATGFLYVDGVLTGTHTADFALSSSDLWSVGQEWDGGGPSEFFNGTVDDVRIYNKVLTEAEVANAMRGDLRLAWDPKPTNRSTPYIKDATSLSWSPGDNASQHDVYFGIDKDAVDGADAFDTTGIYRGRQSITSYSPPEGVEWGGGPYYWRIDEYNTDATISKGGIWSFTVADFIVVDDFEDYNDYPPDEIWFTWVDGYEVPTNGSTVGYPDPDWGAGEHYVETTIVHSGAQSMPFFYDNNFKYSEATRTLSYPRDWTEQGVGVLSLWFYGDTANVAEQMYVALNGSAVVYHENPSAAQIATWTEWTIDLQEFAAKGVNLANVNTITIGFGDKNNLQAGGSGLVFFDDIRLYRPAPEPEPTP